MTDIPIMRVCMVVCILDNILLNVGLFLIAEFGDYKNWGGPMLMFPSLITELWNRAKFEEYSGDNRISPKPPIYPLKMHGEGATSKSKKKNLFGLVYGLWSQLLQVILSRAIR